MFQLSRAMNGTRKTKATMYDCGYIRRDEQKDGEEESRNYAQAKRGE